MFLLDPPYVFFFDDVWVILIMFTAGSIAWRPRSGAVRSASVSSRHPRAYKRPAGWCRHSPTDLGCLSQHIDWDYLPRKRMSSETSFNITKSGCYDRGWFRHSMKLALQVQANHPASSHTSIPTGPFRSKSSGSPNLLRPCSTPKSGAFFWLWKLCGLSVYHLFTYFASILI